MARTQRKATTSQVYERLINRLDVALDSAQTAVQLRNEHSAEVELRGLSHAELELINAYLNRSEREVDRRSHGSSHVQETPSAANVIWLKDRVKQAKG
ncbi:MULTISPECIES: hypothetical protein [Pseudomonas]|uniref:hypothetical protein n=1 Tax=Pseudomonas TaxID=286 RepID=UPI000641D53E|nr:MULTISPECIES: hypothetical protein [Pseudomonas]KMM87148.1 hypothetical protein TU74_19300 [Pseudomonas lundensis]MBM1185557.1 hypothetical protein [Pseudomonas lundensis]MBS5840402.1 hypothetical protein [Pseudomonas sp.]NLT99236.1 hypothetical protein [Pseudomonas lundensis]NNA03260.1 hypothetical protein [Pseudomonas lundensis]